MEPIYLDYNSTAPIDPRVAKIIFESYQAGYVNPASMHQPGQRARRLLEQHRTAILSRLGGNTVGMRADRLIFTSGGTESNNLAIFGLLNPKQSNHRILVSAVEHPSILMAAARAGESGLEVEQIPVDSLGRVLLEALESMVAEKQTDLVSVMLANNETGILQPLSEIVKICHRYGVTVHSDAVQAVGKIPVHFNDLGVDALTFTAHKFHGPRGIGGLILKNELQPVPLLYGGFQQMGIRPGTEDVSLVTGFSKAVELAVSEQEKTANHLKRLRDRLQERLLEMDPTAIVNSLDRESGEDFRAPHTLNISFPGVDRQEFLMAADFQELAISTGSACASGSSEPSHVLLAMGGTGSIIEGSIRISVGIPSTADQIEQAADRISIIINDLRRSN